MKAEDNPRSIKYYVKKFFQREKKRFMGKKVLDFPAGNGLTSKILQDIGAIVIPFDLFPEYFNIDGLTCKRANINEEIPLRDKEVDAIICQEGIEHFENQLFALREFNRILKTHGSLIITTPNASNLVGKLSYLLSENELFNKMMPQNELDDIWMSNQEISNEVYYGHIFLIGINKLRLLAKLSGFKIKNIENTRVKTTAVILLIFFYPFILLSNLIAYRRNLKKNQDFSMTTKREVYGEIFKLAINPRFLVNSHIFIEFEKSHDITEVKNNLPSKHKEFGET
ncbi:MAG: class I SAM-dependent methyltransferase [Sulfurimonas sp.]|nr:class I SAM-dependent methyltransferase [Sulfurimonas sp.]